MSTLPVENIINSETKRSWEITFYSLFFFNLMQWIAISYQYSPIWCHPLRLLSRRPLHFPRNGVDLQVFGSKISMGVFANFQPMNINGCHHKNLLSSQTPVAIYWLKYFVFEVQTLTYVNVNIISVYSLEMSTIYLHIRFFKMFINPISECVRLNFNP